MKIVICSDVHLGFEDKDPVRRNDSYDAFEEVLMTARAVEADLVLVGGDLFHEQNPSTECFNRTIRLLSRHVLGQRSQVEVLTDTEANWLSEVVNVGLPVISIHGNHDEPFLDSGVSALDLLNSSRLITYLRNTELSGQLHVKPNVLTKSGTTVAVYGMGYVKDQVLHQMFRDNKVIFHPSEADFSILLLHQNRYKGQGTPHEQCLPEHWVPSFINVVIWGNEHESLPDFSMSPLMNGRVIQPGSTVATSLIAAEARPKHAILIDVNPGTFEVINVPLKSPRPFLFRQVELGEHCRDVLEAEGFLRKLIEGLLEELSSQPQDSHRLPLIKVKAEVTGFEHLKAAQINSEFADRVANKKILATWKRRKQADQLQGLELRCEKTELLDMITDNLNSKTFSLFSSEMLTEALKASIEHSGIKDFSDLWDSRVAEATKACAEVDLGALEISEVLARLNLTSKKPRQKRDNECLSSTEPSTKRLKFT